MKILHTGDWHCSEGPRLARTLACLDFMIADAFARAVDLVLIGGDMHGTTVPHVATVIERNAVAMRIQALAEIAPVVLIYGNHDAPGDLDVYAQLAAAHPIYVASVPRVVSVRLANVDVEVFCLPYPSKRVYGSSIKGSDPGIEAQKQTIEGALRLILAGWRVWPRTDVHVALMHINIGGSRVGGGERILIGQEIELAPADLDELGMDYIALNHIHEHQRMARGAYYSSTPAPQDFGHRAPCGYVIADVMNELVDVQFRPTPAPRMLTVELTYKSTDGWCCDAWHDVAGADVKLRLHVGEDDVWAPEVIDHLEEQLRAAGAVGVARELETTPRTRTRAPELAAAATIAEKFRVWLECRGVDTTEEQRAAALFALEEIEHAAN